MNTPPELKNLNDRELLIVLYSKVESLTDDVKEMKDVTNRRVDQLSVDKVGREEVARMKKESDKLHDDHEFRLRKIEKDQNNFKGKYVIIAGLVIMVLSAALSWLVNHP